jgi:hypothetical protein
MYLRLPGRRPRHGETAGQPANALKGRDARITAVCLGLVIAVAVFFCAWMIHGFSPTMLLLHPPSTSHNRSGSNAADPVPITTSPSGGGPEPSQTHLIAGFADGRSTSPGSSATSRPSHRGGDTSHIEQAGSVPQVSWIAEPPPMPSATTGVSSSSNQTTGSASASVAATPTETAASTDPDTLPVNAPGSAAHVSSVLLGAAEPDGSQTVNVTGLRPGNNSTVTGAAIDWGDGTSATNTSFDDASPFPVSGLTLSHSYASPGTYTISWSYSSDRTHHLAYPITLRQPADAAPDQQLNVSDSGSDTADFDASDSSGSTWAHWLLDFGDGSYAAGTDMASFAADGHTHDYSSTPNTAVLTVIDIIGQLTTVTASAP